MAALSLSEVADLATSLGVCAALISAAIAWRGWRHRTGHWLYIPAPNLLTQDPGRPEFWVFPPQEIQDGTFGLVIAGMLINAGPSDAFSVDVYVESELTLEEGIEVLEEIAKLAADHENSSGDRHEILRGFLNRYPRKEPSAPVLRVGEQFDFVVIARLKAGDTYLEELLQDKDRHAISCHWSTDEKDQAHGVHASSHTSLGRKIVFGPDDLCSPFGTNRKRLLSSLK
ncbi:MAG TPA: hypothetical protein VF030_07340 [Solirubrobacterales bacterium]